MAVTDEAIEKIKGMIVSGALRPGDRLPKESELAAELGLSRNSLREAVRALSLIRILDVRQGDGTYVTSLDPQLLLEALSFVVDFHRDDTVLEFLAVRRILEPAATAMAASRISEQQLDALSAQLEKLGDAPSVVRTLTNFRRWDRSSGKGSAETMNTPQRRPSPSSTSQVHSSACEPAVASHGDSSPYSASASPWYRLALSPPRACSSA